MIIICLESKCIIYECMQPCTRTTWTELTCMNEWCPSNRRTKLYLILYCTRPLQWQPLPSTHSCPPSMVSFVPVDCAGMCANRNCIRLWFQCNAQSTPTTWTMLRWRSTAVSSFVVCTSRANYRCAATAPRPSCEWIPVRTQSIQFDWPTDASVGNWGIGELPITNATNRMNYKAFTFGNWSQHRTIRSRQ